MFSFYFLFLIFNFLKFDSNNWLSLTMEKGVFFTWFSLVLRFWPVAVFQMGMISINLEDLNVHGNDKMIELFSWLLYHLGKFYLPSKYEILFLQHPLENESQADKYVVILVGSLFMFLLIRFYNGRFYCWDYISEFILVDMCTLTKSGIRPY